MKKIILTIIFFSIKAVTLYSNVTGFSETINYTRCDFAEVYFYCVDDSYPNINGVKYCWNFGDGTGFCDTTGLYAYNPYNTYSKPGSYTVTLAYINNGDTNLFIKSNLIIIKKAPKVDFIYAPIIDTSYYIYAPAAINFINNTQKGDGDSISYTWSFSDSASSNDTNITRVFTKPGTYNVKLSVTDNYGCHENTSKVLYLQTQSNTYYPFPMKNALWTEFYNSGYPDYNTTFHCFALKNNDTVIKGKTYHKLYNSTDTTFTEDKLCGGIRVVDKQVFYYSINPVQYGYMSLPKDSEVMIYDFSVKLGDFIGDTIHRVNWISYPEYLRVDSIDSMLIDTAYRKRYFFGYPEITPPVTVPWAQWVEGIGHLRGIIYKTGNYVNDGTWNDLICFWQDGKLLYHYYKYSECFYIGTNIKDNIRNRDEISVYPNPAIKTAHIDFMNNQYNSLELFNSNGIKIKQFNVRGQKEMSFNVENLPPGIYLVVLRSNDSHVKTIKFVIK